MRAYQGQSSETEMMHLGRPKPIGRILLVDDDCEVLETIASLLEKDGFQVDKATNGASGWAALCTRSYDLLITDYMMPSVNGAELLRRTRTLPFALPCILISSAIPWHDAELPALLQPGAAVEKTFTFVEVRDKARELLQVASSSERSVPAFPM